MKKSVNDIGGEDWGPIPMTHKEVPDWAKLSTALRGALGDKGAGLVSCMKAAARGKKWDYERYHALGYFEMGMQAILDILVQKKVVTEQEVQDRIDRLKVDRLK